MASSSSQSKRGNEDMDDLDTIVQARNSRKHRSQKFRLEWCKDDELRDWLLPDKNDVHKARCKYCNVQFVAELTNIRGHGNGKKHKSLLASLTSGTKTQKSISTFVTKNISSDLKLQVSRAEIKIASFVAEHNISFLATDHLTEMLKECFPDSNIAKNLAMKRTKSTAIIKNVIGLSHKESLAVTLRKTKFSVLTDESTDIGTVKTACVVIRLVIVY